MQKRKKHLSDKEGFLIGWIFGIMGILYIFIVSIIEIIKGNSQEVPNLIIGYLKVALPLMFLVGLLFSLFYSGTVTFEENDLLYRRKFYKRQEKIGYDYINKVFVSFEYHVEDPTRYSGRRIVLFHGKEVLCQFELNYALLRELRKHIDQKSFEVVDFDFQISLSKRYKILLWDCFTEKQKKKILKKHKGFEAKYITNVNEDDF